MLLACSKLAGPFLSYRITLTEIYLDICGFMGEREKKIKRESRASSS